MGVRVVRGEVRGGEPLLLMETAPTVVEGGGARLMMAAEIKKFCC